MLCFYKPCLLLPLMRAMIRNAAAADNGCCFLFADIISNLEAVSHAFIQWNDWCGDSQDQDGPPGTEVEVGQCWGSVHIISLRYQYNEPSGWKCSSCDSPHSSALLKSPWGCHVLGAGMRSWRKSRGQKAHWRDIVCMDDKFWERKAKSNFKWVSATMKLITKRVYDCRCAEVELERMNLCCPKNVIEKLTTGCT